MMPPRYVAMLELGVCADESGTDNPTAAYVSVMGYMATPEAWDAARASWRDALAKADVPYFHAIEFFHRERWRSSSSYYNGWDEEIAK